MNALSVRRPARSLSSFGVHISTQCPASAREREERIDRREERHVVDEGAGAERVAAAVEAAVAGLHLEEERDGAGELRARDLGDVGREPGDGIGCAQEVDIGVIRA